MAETIGSSPAKTPAFFSRHEEWWHPLNLLFPQICLSCDLPVYGKSIVCRSCESLIELTNLGQWGDQLHYSDAIDDAYSGFWYVQTVKALIHSMKYAHKRKVAPYLARELFEAMFTDAPWNQYECLVPVPLYRSRARERGYNQSLLLAEALSKLVGIPVENNLLIKHRATQSQTRLTADLRYANVKGSFRCINRGDYGNVLLIDDILTTGATVSACSQALKSVGVEQVGVITVATPPIGD